MVVFRQFDLLLRSLCLSPVSRYIYPLWPYLSHAPSPFRLFDSCLWPGILASLLDFDTFILIHTLGLLYGRVSGCRRALMETVGLLRMLDVQSQTHTCTHINAELLCNLFAANLMVSWTSARVMLRSQPIYLSTAPGGGGRGGGGGGIKSILYISQGL